MKLFKRLLWAVLAAAVLVIVFKNEAVKAALTIGTKQITGLDVDLAKVDLSFTKSRVELAGLRLENPADFQDRVLADIPYVLMDYSLGDLLKGKLHLENIQFHLKELSIIRNRSGKLNLDAFKTAQGAKEEAPQKAETGQASVPPQPLRIDALDLRIEKLVFKDYSLMQDPVVKIFDLNIHEKHENISDPEMLVKIILARTLRTTAISGLTEWKKDFLPEDLFQTGSVPAKALAEKGVQAVSRVEQTLVKTTGLMGEKSKELAGSLRENVKIPFSKNKE